MIIVVIVSLLRYLLEAKVKFKWTEVCLCAFNQLKEVLTGLFVSQERNMWLLCIVWYFRQYLLDREFWYVVTTDHSAFRWSMSLKDLQDQMAQWLGVLSQCRVNIVRHDE